MWLRYSLGAMVSILGLSLLTACSLQYNGAFGVESDAGKRTSATGTAGESTAGHTPAVRGAHSGAARATLVSDNADTRRGRPLGVYGELPGSPGGVSSPLDGTDNLRQITFATEGADFDPALDPTGKWLVYASTQHRETADLYLKRVDGRTVTQLTNDPGNDVTPTFSPDGQRIAYASDRAGNWDIYIMDVNGGQSIQLTNDVTHDLHPSFSPDGRHLVYSTLGSQSGQWELVVIDIDNPARKRFIGYGLFPKWSPVDNRILFQRARERGTRWFSVWTIDLVNDEGTRPTEIAASSNAALITPSWSPDGKHVVFCTVVDPTADETQRPDVADIWVVDIDGNSRSRLTRGQFRNLQPVWSPDGTIYFVGNRSPQATENIWAIRPDRAIQLATGIREAGSNLIEADAGDKKPASRSAAVNTGP